LIVGTIAADHLKSAFCCGGVSAPHANWKGLHGPEGAVSEKSGSSGGFSMGCLASVVDSTNFALGLGILVRHDVTSNTLVQVNGEQQEGN
jgi:hypothetical protein